MVGRTVILVSHHVQLCAQGATYIVALDNGRVQYQGDRDQFLKSEIIQTLVQSGSTEPGDSKDDSVAPLIEENMPKSSPDSRSVSETSSTIAVSSEPEVKTEKKKPRALVEEEKRAVGRISKAVWKTYILACGSQWYWLLFLVIVGLAALSPVAENKWLQ